MLGHTHSVRYLRLRSDYAVQIIVYLFGVVITGGMFFVSLFYLCGGKQSGDRLGWVWPMVAGAIGICLIGYEILKTLRNGYMFYVLGEKQNFSSKEFDAANMLQIGPLTNLENKTLVLNLRWRPQPENTPKVKSFRLQLQTPPEPSATFEVQLFGQTGDKEVQVAVQSIIQKIDLTARAANEQAAEEYDDWREITFSITDSFPQYFLKVRLAIDRPDEKRENYEDTLSCKTKYPKVLERLWVEMFVGLKLDELNNPDNYKISNVGVADICVV